MSDNTDVLQGTLDLLIMRTVALGPLHGWAIAQRIQQISDDLLRGPAGLALSRSTASNTRAGSRPNGARRKTAAARYALTKAGRKQLEAEVAKWERLSAGVNLVLRRT